MANADGAAHTLTSSPKVANKQSLVWFRLESPDALSSRFCHVALWKALADRSVDIQTILPALIA